MADGNIANNMERGPLHQINLVDPDLEGADHGMRSHFLLCMMSPADDKLSNIM